MALCESLSYRDWAGYFAVSAYELPYDREYNAIRQAAALFDISPLFKYRLSGKDAARAADRILTRDVTKLGIGQVAYTHWCDGDGKVLDDGTLARLEPDVYRWTAAEPNLRWIARNAAGLEVRIEDVSESLAALALQGPTSRAILENCAESDVRGLGYFRVMASRIAGIPVDISRTGYTGDLGYEIWVPAEHALALWDALIAAGRAFGLQPAGMLALDVARIEAGLILLDVDYVSVRKALIPSQKYTPYELGLGRLVHLDKAPFVGQAALRREKERGPERRLCGIEIAWDDIERLHAEAGLAPQLAPTASRVAVPIYHREEQVGRATSSTWSPTLKKLIALASVGAEHADVGSALDFELTVEHQRRRARATVVPLPFFDPPRKRASGGS